MQRRASQRNHHYIYKTTCQKTGKWYIGMHSTDDLDDGYLGSGMLLWKSIKKYGKEFHTKEIVHFCETRSDLAALEEILVAEAKKDPMCMNLANGGIGYFDRPNTSEETRRKLSEASLGKRKSAQHCESIRKARIGVPSSSKSKNGKPWIITRPDGTTISVVSLKKWASDNGIQNYRRLRASRPVDGFLAKPEER